MSATVGVLALQGDVPEHRDLLLRVPGIESVLEVRTPEHLERVGALFLPGGESTTVSRLLDEFQLREPLVRHLREGLPAFATCAGLITLAKEIEPSPHGRDPSPLGILDVRVRRNDYGRQVDSFELPLRFPGLGEAEFLAVFIRAPRILRTGPRVEVLATDGKSPVAVREGRIWGLTFHPELAGDIRLHRWFLESTGVLPSAPGVAGASPRAG